MYLHHFLYGNTLTKSQYFLSCAYAKKAKSQRFCKLFSFETESLFQTFYMFKFCIVILYMLPILNNGIED